MMKKRVYLSSVLVLAAALFFATRAHAQAVDVTEETEVEGASKRSSSGVKTSGEVGPGAARKYFRARQDKSESTREVAQASGERYLALTLGTFISEDTYKWGHNTRDDVGQLNAGVTYKLGEWKSSMDLMFKADITTYGLTEGRAVKLSLIPTVSFPDVASGFPLYFGGGAGLGVFFKQIEDESSLSLDYTIFAGARFFNVIENVGLLFEAGMKNHILLLSDGQYNGVYVNFGTVFSF